MNEAMNYTGQFLDWSEDRRDERIRWLRQTIERHVIGEFGIAFSREALRSVYGDTPFGRNPYFLAHFSLVKGLATSLAGFGLELQPVDFVFDEQMTEKRHVVGAWEIIRERNRLSSDIKTVLKNMPDFRDDKEVLPLQAADMHAWCLRKAVIGSIKGQRWTPPFPQIRKINGLAITISEEQMRMNREAQAIAEATNAEVDE